jgi:hydroxyacylglutathione hydrolase
MALAEALERRDRGEAVLIDVRSAKAYRAGHIPGAVNIAAREIDARAAEIRKMGALILTAARRGLEAVRACQRIDARVLADGVHGWEATGRPLAEGPAPGGLAVP